MREPDVNLKKTKICEPDINPGGASSLTADTPKRGESEQGSNAENEGLLAGGVLRRSTNFCVTRHLSTSAEIALH